MSADGYKARVDDEADRALSRMNRARKLAPLIGADGLTARPDAPVLVVGNAEAQAVASAAITGMVVVSTPHSPDLTPLHGRDVLLWATAGSEAAMHKLAARLAASRLRWINTDGLPDGFDATKVEGSRAAWCKARVVPYTPVGEPLTAAHEKPPAARESARRPAEDGAATPQGVSDDDTRVHTTDATPSLSVSAQTPQDVVGLPNGTGKLAYSEWALYGLSTTDKGIPHPNIDNACRVLEQHPDFLGHLWYDSFVGRILTTWPNGGEAREWRDADDGMLAMWFQRVLGMPKMQPQTASTAATVYALAHPRNECQEWLRSLRWDGIERLPGFMPIAFGTESNPYYEAIGRCWLVSMVARVLRPGCKVDTMPVFEGAQGILKSTALQALVGSRWFAEASENPTSKDFFQALQGKMLVEIGEMASFSNHEVETIKRVLSCQVDRYRAPYGRRAEDHPRQGVFGGTANKNDWNRDETGARRFWPVACATIDLPWIRRWREQLFAEAVARLDRGEQWWDVPVDDAKREQEARRQVDEWEPLVAQWLALRTMQRITSGEVLEGALGIKPDKWDRPMQLRMGRILKVLGWVASLAWHGGQTIRAWTKPY